MVMIVAVETDVVDTCHVKLPSDHDSTDVY